MNEPSHYKREPDLSRTNRDEGVGDVVPNPGDLWYFAYGSNMSSQRKTDRTGTIRSARQAKLSGYRLAFNKRANSGGVYANIVVDPAEEVWGVVYLCNTEAMAELDKHEGVIGGHYKQKWVKVTIDSGEVLDVITYVASERYVVEEGVPSDEYLNHILMGAIEHSLPAAYCEKVRRRVAQSKSSRRQQ